MKSKKIYFFKEGKGIREAEKVIRTWFHSEGRILPDHFSFLTDEDLVQEVPGSKALNTPDSIDLLPFEVAKDISNACPKDFLLNSLDNKGLWLWLTIFYLTNLRKLKDINYYIPQTSSEYDYQRWYKHMLRQTVLVYEKFGIDSKILMPKKLGMTTDAMEWSISSPWFLESNIIRVANMIYRDEDQASWLKTNALNRKKKGWIKHYNWFIKKLRAVYIVEEMSPEEIYEIVRNDSTFSLFTS
tara:strand:+ start:1130 stop:1855 length:726 start_codon:yes stop_codon:yes gene_type:complete